MDGLNLLSGQLLKNLVTAVLLGCLAPQCLRAENAAPSQLGLTVRDGRFFKDGRPYRGVGANYFDPFLRLLRKPNDTSGLEGLKQLAAAKVPFVRFAACGFGAKEWQFYLKNKEEYFRRMDQVVQTAEREQIGLIPSLFWTLALSEAAGEPRDQWGNPDSKTIQLMRQYVAEVVCRYKNSPAIWAWEFGNELNLQADLPNAANFRPKGGSERDDLKSPHLVVALTEFAKEIRRHDPSRAIISGNSHPRASAWHNTQERSWKSDTQEQTLFTLFRDNPAPLDTIGIHIYGDTPVKQVAAWATDWPHYLRTLKAAARQVGRPVFVGEFGLAENGKPESVRTTFEQILAAMESEQVDLAAFWVFDLPGQAKTWSVTFTNGRAYMLQLSAEAHQRWNKQ